MYICSLVLFLWFPAFQEVHEHSCLCEIASFPGFLKVAEVWSLVPVAEIGCQCFSTAEVGLGFHDVLIHIFHDSIAQWMFQATGHMPSRLASPLSRQNVAYFFPSPNLNSNDYPPNN